jgi:hypothetical protein
MQGFAGDARAEFSARLRARGPEIEHATLARIYGVADPGRSVDSRYVVGLRAAVSAAVDYGLALVELDDWDETPVPAILLTQARVAARNDVGLDTVLRRYVAGHALLGDFLVDEADRSGLSGAVLKQLLRSQAEILERVLVAVSEEHVREESETLRPTEKRRLKRVEGLLEGRLIETPDFSYDFGGNHLGVVVAATRGTDMYLHRLASALDRRLLLVRRDLETVWAWLGGPRTTEPSDVERVVLATWPPNLAVAIGAPADGLLGWRLTHRQARIAMPLAQRSPARFASYVASPVLASVLQDEFLEASLRRLYIEPLARKRDGGDILKKTLRAYFASEGNASSTAAALCVSRQTVINRVHTVEGRLGQPLRTCMADLEIALRLDELDGSTVPLDRPSTDTTKRAQLYKLSRH